MWLYLALSNDIKESQFFINILEHFVYLLLFMIIYKSFNLSDMSFN